MSKYNDLYHWVDKDKCMHRKDGKILVPTSSGFLALNKDQFELLELFDNNPRSIERIIESYPLEYKNSVSSFVDLLIKKNILIESNKKYKLSFFGYVKKLIFFPLPYKMLNYIVGIISDYINIKIISVIGLIINIAGLITLLPLVTLTGFTIESVPRNILTLLIGFLAGIFHELWLAIYLHKNNMRVKKWYLRIIWGVIVTLAINWSEMLLESRKKRINMFLFVINMTICTASIESILGLVFWYFDFHILAEYLCMFAMGTLIFFGISLWPFLFKGDGYYIFQEITNVYKIRPKFIQQIAFFYRKDQKNTWNSFKRKEKIVLISWGTIFILSILTVDYLIYLGIRIII